MIIIIFCINKLNHLPISHTYHRIVIWQERLFVQRWYTCLPIGVDRTQRHSFLIIMIICWVFFFSFLRIFFESWLHYQLLHKTLLLSPSISFVSLIFSYHNSYLVDGHINYYYYFVETWMLWGRKKKSCFFFTCVHRGRFLDKSFDAAHLLIHSSNTFENMLDRSHAFLQH